MKKQRERRGARVISRYDRTIQKTHVDGKEMEFLWIRLGGRDVYLPLPSQDQLAAQLHGPVQIGEVHWLYHDHWVEMRDAHTYRPNEVVLFIKRAVLREERELARARQEVETLERFGDLPIVAREMIPDAVRMFVWQRDGGKCVRCGTRDKLEFDHIIPVADGGSSTERNVQLLCEPCNRSKGRSVS